MRHRPALALVLVTALAAPHGAAQSGDGEWRYYGGDAASRKYSPLAEIAPANVARLQVPPPETRKLYALDKATGAVLWASAPPIPGPMAAPMTYRHQVRQYLVVAAGAGLSTGLVAYALPR